MRTQTIERTILLPDHREVTVEICVSFSEELYGADADGNRGVWTEVVAGYDFECPECDDNGEVLYKDDIAFVEDKIDVLVHEAL